MAGPAAGLAALLVARLDPVQRRLLSCASDERRRLLDETQRRVSSMLRAADRYAFASREEIWLLLPDLASEALGRLAAHALRERLRRPVGLPAGRHALLQPAVGGAWVRAGRKASPAALVGLALQAAAPAGDADEAVRIEEAGSPGNPAEPGAEDRAEMVRRLLEGNALELHFQPKVDLRTGRCRAAEALVRWPKRQGGPGLDPAGIVAVCEQRGLAGALTRFTLNAALRHMAAWRGAGLDVSVAVNLSATMLADSRLPMAVSQALQTWGVPAARLTLELTESALVRDEETASAVMLALRDLGCRLSIDDFGTGHSPYTYLRRFPVHELKIDRSFVEPALRDPRDRAIVASLVSLARAFGVQVVAEGVEDARTEAFLAQIGCDLGQGWHYAPALEPGAFAAWCARRDASAGPA